MTSREGVLFFRPTDPSTTISAAAGHNSLSGNDHIYHGLRVAQGGAQRTSPYTADGYSESG
jgi:hypothetical protein